MVQQFLDLPELQFCSVLDPRLLQEIVVFLRKFTKMETKIPGMCLTSSRLIMSSFSPVIP
jgi:hypothetical protein